MLFWMNAARRMSNAEKDQTILHGYGTGMRKLPVPEKVCRQFLQAGEREAYAGAELRCIPGGKEGMKKETLEKRLIIFGANFQDVIYHSDLKPEELAESVGISESQLQRYIEGKGVPGLKDFVKIIFATNCTTKETMQIITALYDDLVRIGEIVESEEGEEYG